MSMNAIEEIAKTQPKENAGALTSKRFEYQMNWGLSKLLELEERGEDYTIAFDYQRNGGTGTCSATIGVG